MPEPILLIVKLIDPTVAETEPFGLKRNVVAALTLMGDDESGTELPTFVNEVAGGASLNTWDVFNTLSNETSY